MRRTQRGRATLAPSVHFRGGRVHPGVALAILGTLLVASACNLLSGYQQGPSPGPSTAAPSAGPASSSPGGDESMTPCERAPDWLIAALTKGLAVPGATLSEVFVGEASITSGLSGEVAPSFVTAWWVVAKVNGAGVRPTVGIWVTNRMASGPAGDILAANAAALRSTTFGHGGQVPLLGSGLDELLTCLSPIPES